MKKVGPYDFVFGLATVWLLMSLLGPWVLFPLFAWMVVDAGIWLWRSPNGRSPKRRPASGRPNHLPRRPDLA